MPSLSSTTTVPPRTTPTVLWACAAIGALIAAAIAAMASILFRMLNSFAGERAGWRTMRANSSRAALFRKSAAAYAAISGIFLGRFLAVLFAVFWRLFPAVFLIYLPDNFSGAGTHGRHERLLFRNPASG